MGVFTIYRHAGRNSRNESLWETICPHCGGVYIAPISTLRNGKCCGCVPSMGGLRHGGYGSPEYRSWSNMLTRCYNPKATRFKDWGGRGITVCESWRRSFEAFLTDMGPKPTTRHTIDRTDNDGNYEPGNCRWATYAEQSSNQRKRPPHSAATRAKHARNAHVIRFWEKRDLSGTGPLEGCPIRDPHHSSKCKHCGAARMRLWRASLRVA